MAQLAVSDLPDGFGIDLPILQAHIQMANARFTAVSSIQLSALRQHLSPAKS